jgi:hypothetical protein
VNRCLIKLVAIAVSIGFEKIAAVSAAAAIITAKTIPVTMIFLPLTRALLSFYL